MSVIDELIQNLPKDIVLTGDEITRPYESDGLTVFRQKPLAVILSGNFTNSTSFKDM